MGYVTPGGGRIMLCGYVSASNSGRFEKSVGKGDMRQCRQARGKNPCWNYLKSGTGGVVTSSSDLSLGEVL